MNTGDLEVQAVIERLPAATADYIVRKLGQLSCVYRAELALGHP